MLPIASDKLQSYGDRCYGMSYLKLISMYIIKARLILEKNFVQ